LTREFDEIQICSKNNKFNVFVKIYVHSNTEVRTLFGVKISDTNKWLNKAICEGVNRWWM